MYRKFETSGMSIKKKTIPRYVGGGGMIPKDKEFDLNCDYYCY